VNRPCTRRRFVVRALKLGAVAALGAPLLARCGMDLGEDDDPRAQAEQYDADLRCTDTTGLLEAELKVRVENNYVQISPHEEHYCFNCLNFEEPAEPGTCGACDVVPGPIQPLGWCEAWLEIPG
jgi:hypothetical protein